MKEIVNVNAAWGIGKDGDLLVHLPADMKYFREQTKDAVVILGSNTLDSFPGKAPLKNRTNIVLVDDLAKISKDSVDAAVRDQRKGLSTDLLYVTSIEDAIREAGQRADLRDVFVIGGASIYRSFLPYCEECLVTINDSPREADTFFPDLSQMPEWQMTEEGEEQEENGIRFRFTRWRKEEN